MTRQALLIGTALILAQTAVFAADNKPIIYVNSFENCPHSDLPENVLFDVRPHAGNIYRTKENCMAVENNPPYGKKSLQIEVPEKGDVCYVQIYLNPPLTFTPGTSYTFSVYAKADRKDAQVGLGIWWGTKHEKQFKVGAEWQRLVLTFTPDVASSMLAINVKKGARVWLDAVQIEEGEVSPFAPDAKTLDPRCYLDESKKGIPAENPRYAITKTEKAPVIDGEFTDECWKNATVYTIASPKDGAKGLTEFKMVSDDANIYLAVTCHEPDMKKLVAVHTAHDSPVYTDDSLEIFMQDFPGFYPWYNHFMVNSIGTQADERCGKEGWDSNPWWSAKTRKYENRWDAEIMIHVDYNAANVPTDTPLLFNLCRSRASANEYLPWSGKYHQPLTFPVITGIKRPGPLLKELDFDFGFGATADEFTIKYLLKNVSGKDLVFQPQLVVKREKGEETVSAAETALTADSSGKISFRIPRKPDEVKFKVQLFSSAKRQRVVSENEVEIANMIKGPLLRHNVYLPADKGAEFKIDLAKFSSMTNGELALAVEDVFGEKRWEQTLSIEDTVSGKIPLDTLKPGNFIFCARILSNKKALVASEMHFRLVEKKGAAPVVRTDRFKRALMRGNEYVTGVCGASYFPSTDSDEGKLADLQKIGAKIVCLAVYKHSGDTSLISVSQAKAALDLAEKYGFKCVIGSHFGRLPLLLDKRRLFQVYAMMEAIKDHPAVLAYDLIDEPDAACLPKMSAATPLLQELDPFHPVTLNINHGQLHIKDWHPFQNGFTMADCYADTRGVYYDAKGVRKCVPWNSLYYWTRSYNEGEGRRLPSPQEFLSYSYAAIVNGASIIAPFVYKPMSLELYNSWKTLADEMETIKDALTTEDFRDFTTPDEKIGASLRRTDKGLYVICVTLSDKTENIRLELPGFSGKDAAVEVIFENRKVQMSNGIIEDEFAPLARRVYFMKP